MVTVIHRLDRGAFTGVVFRYDDGPYRGWFGYRFSAGPDRAGSCSVIGKSAAMSKLHAEMLDYFRNSRHQADTPHP